MTLHNVSVQYKSRQYDLNYIHSVKSIIQSERNLQKMLIKPHATADNSDISWITKQTQCWVYFPEQTVNSIYVKAVIKGIVPLAFNKSNSKVICLLQNGTQYETKASCLERRRHSNSIEKDLIQLEVINAAEILDQLKRRLQLKRIHMYLWNSLIIVNPFYRINDMYSEETMHFYREKIIHHKKALHQLQPHIYGFVANVINKLKQSTNIQFLSISGQSGSGKTQTNKQCLRIISYACEAHQKNVQNKHSLIEQRVLNCDYIIQCFGNAKTSKNDNSSRFGKLVTQKINIKTMQITRCEIKVFFLEKSRIIHQFEQQRNFHIFYQLIQFSDQVVKKHLGLKTDKKILRKIDFAYLNQHSPELGDDSEMWDNLQNAFDILEINEETVLYIYQIIAAILHLGNLKFDDHCQNDTDPCEIINDDLIPLIANLLMLSPKQFSQGLIFNKKKLAGQLMHIPMTERQCIEGRDSMAKALYENLFLWIIQEITHKVNEEQKMEQNIRVIKMLDIYGFQVFDWNSFEQLNVNYTNQRIHQVYLSQVFKHQKAVLRKQGLESAIPSIKFQDNTKIIQLLDTMGKSIYNLLDESCSLNVRDEDFLNNVKKICNDHQNFPATNNITTKKCFIIKHTPGAIQYFTEGFRAKNKDFLREDIAQKLSKSKMSIISNKFTKQLEKIRNQTNRKFLGFKMRKQVNLLITQMSTQTDMHFIKCIKPNQKKKALTFVDRVSYNQIRYLGILDTIVMRKDCYHVRMNYMQFYSRYGIIKGDVKQMIELQRGRFSNLDCKQMSKRLLDQQFKKNDLDYLFGNQRIFIKMETHNLIEIILKKKMSLVSYQCTIIKAIWRNRKNRNQKLNYSVHIKKVQKSVRSFLRDIITIKRKIAVQVIQRQWIKRCDQYFRRKKRNSLMILQKYIKKSFRKNQMTQRVTSISKAKILLSSILKAHVEADKYQKFLDFKFFFKKYIFNEIQIRMEKKKIQSLHKYFKGFTTVQANKKKIVKAREQQKHRLLIKSKYTIEKYFHTVSFSDSHRRYLRAVVKIQKNFKMRFWRKRFLQMRQIVVFLQRSWRKYKYEKSHNQYFTQQYFASSNEMQDQWKHYLYRNLNKNSLNTNYFGFESILNKFQKIKKDKIVLFYYLLDYEILSEDASLQNWVDNYITLAEESMLKLSPIQIVDVTNSYTTCSTINKMYSWGCIDVNSQKFHTSNRYPYQQHYFSEGKIQKFSVRDESISIQLSNPAQKIKIGDGDDQSQRDWSTLLESYVLLNGMVLTVSGLSFIKINIPQKVNQISCGMSHTICKTILKKVFTWGKNSQGQLGTGDYFQNRQNTPRLVDYFIKRKIQVVQVSASATSSIVLDANCRMYWFGSNGTIKDCCYPEQCLLASKSVFLGNNNKYCPIRIVSRWSKTISVIGVTIACFDGIFKNQIPLRKKVIQNVISKWNDDIHTVNPPYIQSSADYIGERHMPLPFSQTNYKKLGPTNKQIREKIISEINMMEETQRQLLKQRRKKDPPSYGFSNSKFKK